MKLGEYELFEPIASGGMAEVYRGRALGAEGFEKAVVIKRILPHFASDDRMVQMLVQEARIHAALAHRNIVQIHDLGQTDSGEYFIVLEYVDGHDLGAVIESLARMTPEPQRMRDALALHIVSELAEGVHFAHEVNGPDGKPAGLVHRDISPSNVLLSYSGEVKLSDFGLAKRLTDNSVIGTLKGKLAYMSPEQAKRWQLDRRSDIFSMGAVLFELLTGKRLRQIVDETDGFRLVASGVMTAPRAARPDLPIALEQVLTRALAPNPQDRFATAQQLAIALRSCLNELPRDSAGETGELAGLLYRMLPKGAPRPSTEPSRVIRLHSEFFGGTRFDLERPTAHRGTPPPPIPNAARRATTTPSAADRLATTQPLRPIKTAPEPPPRHSTLTGSPPGEIEVDMTDLPIRAALPSSRQPVPLPGMSAPRSFSPAPPRQAPVSTAPDVRAALVGGNQAAPGIDGIMRDMLKQTVEAPHAAPITARQIAVASRPTPVVAAPKANAPVAPPIVVAMRPSESTPKMATPSAVTREPVRFKSEGGEFWKGLFFIAFLLAVAAGAAHVFVAPMPVLVTWFSPVRLVIRTQPAGAIVSLDGVRIVGASPTVTDVMRDRRDHVIETEKDGYIPSRSIVRFDQTVELAEEIRLQKVGGPRSTRLPDTEPAIAVIPDAGSAGAAEAPSEVVAPVATERDTVNPVAAPVARKTSAAQKNRGKKKGNGRRPR